MEDNKRLETEEMESSTNPYICGFCKTEFEHFEKFYIHLKIHNISINKQFHICHSVWDIGDNDAYTCMLCSCKFGTICQLHDHLLHCFDEDGQKNGSYLYHDNQNCQAFPLASLCAFIGSRNCHIEKDFSENSLSVHELFNSRSDINRIVQDFFVNHSNTNKQLSEIKTYKDAATDTSDLTKLTSDRNGGLTCTLTDGNGEQQDKVKRGRKQKNGQIAAKPKQVECRKTSQKTKLKSGSKENDTVTSLVMKKNKKLHSLTCNSEGKVSKGFSETQDDLKMKMKKSLTLRQSMKKINKRVSVADTTNSDSPHETDCRKGFDSDEDVVSTNEQNDGENLGTITPISETTETSASHRKMKQQDLVIERKSQKLRKKPLYEDKEKKPVSTFKKKRGRKKLDPEVCSVCGKKVQRSKMKVHAISHSDVRPHKCEFCPKTYKYREHLALHMKSHSEVLPYYCEVCGQGFIDANRLKRHAIMHTDFRPYTCEECGAGFVTRYKLNRHMLVHTGVKKLQCDLCGMRFAHKENLTQHIAGIHKRERRFACLECNKTFFTNYQLKCHTMKHSGLRPYKCTMCKSDFIERKELRRHMSKQHKMSLDGKPTGQSVELKIDEPVTNDIYREQDTDFQTQQHSTFENTQTASKNFSDMTTSHRIQEIDTTGASKILQQSGNVCDKNEIAKDQLSDSSASHDIAKLNFVDTVKPDLYTSVCVPLSQTTNRFCSPMFAETNQFNYRTSLHCNEESRLFVPSLSSEFVDTSNMNSNS